MKKYVFSLWCSLPMFLLVPLCTFAFVAPGNPTGYVNDYAAVLSPADKDALEQKLRSFNADTSHEIAVVTVKSLDGDYIEHYAEQLFQTWKIGTAKSDNGVLLLVAIDDRKMRIEVGYGLEGALTDAVAATIIRDDLAPAFKEGNYYAGIDKATSDIMAVTQGEYTGDKTARIGTDQSMPLQVVVFLFLMVVQFLAAILGRSKSWWFGGLLGGVAGVVLVYLGLLGMTMVVGSVVTLFLVLFGLLFDFVVSQKFEKSLSSGTPIPWWIGGNHIGGSTSSRGSFGGFGGGSSGGGGASGSW